jgi:hypothetical protein
MPNSRHILPVPNVWGTIRKHFEEKVRALDSRETEEQNVKN